MSKQRRESTIKLRDRRVKEKQLDTVIEQDSPLAYCVISKEESDEFLEITLGEIEKKLQEKFNLNSEIDLKDAVVLDYYTAAMLWCQQQKYKPQQLSIFFTIVYNLLKKIEDEQASLTSLVTEFHYLLFKKGADLKTINEKHFSLTEAKAIIDYVSISLFTHYNLYLYVMTLPQEEKITTNDLSVEVPLHNQVPLDEGLPDDVLSTCFIMETPQHVTLLGEEEIEPVTDIDMDILSNAGDIFALLTYDDVQAVINEACSSVLSKLQSTAEDKIQMQTINSMAKINKIHIVQT